MSDHNIDPDVRATRSHACHYDTTKPVAEQLDAAQTGEEFGAVVSGFINWLGEFTDTDYTNCSGALADLGHDE